MRRRALALRRTLAMLPSRPQRPDGAYQRSPGLTLDTLLAPPRDTSPSTSRPSRPSSPKNATAFRRAAESFPPRLKSDVLVINGGTPVGWAFATSFRSTAARRDHEDRLLKLVTQPASDSLEQAKRWRTRARAQPRSIVRTINMPTLALLFLRKDMQDRSTFTLGGTKKIDGPRRRAALHRARHAAHHRVERRGPPAAASGSNPTRVASSAPSSSSTPETLARRLR